MLHQMKIEPKTPRLYTIRKNETLLICEIFKFLERTKTNKRNLKNIHAASDENRTCGNHRFWFDQIMRCFTVEPIRITRQSWARRRTTRKRRRRQRGRDSWRGWKFCWRLTLVLLDARKSSWRSDHWRNLTVVVVTTWSHDGI